MSNFELEYFWEEILDSLEKFINEKCLEGNEIAIQIRREGCRYFSDKDYNLVRAAIEGNQYAIRALKLETK